MSAIIATTSYTSPISSVPAMFDAGRQPLVTLQFSTPEQKKAVNPWESPIKVKDVFELKRSVEVPKRIADVFFSLKTVSTSANTTYTLNRVEVEDFDDDDDIPIATLMEMVLSSLTTTLKRFPRVKRRTGPKDSGDPDD